MDVNRTLEYKNKDLRERLKGNYRGGYKGVIGTKTGFFHHMNWKVKRYSICFDKGPYLGYNIGETKLLNYKFKKTIGD